MLPRRQSLSPSSTLSTILAKNNLPSAATFPPVCKSAPEAGSPFTCTVQPSFSKNNVRLTKTAFPSFPTQGSPSRRIPAVYSSMRSHPTSRCPRVPLSTLMEITRWPSILPRATEATPAEFAPLHSPLMCPGHAVLISPLLTSSGHWLSQIVVPDPRQSWPVHGEVLSVPGVSSSETDMDTVNAGSW